MLILSAGSFAQQYSNNTRSEKAAIIGNAILLLKENQDPEFPVIIRTIATEKKGLKELSQTILKHQQARKDSEKIELLMEKAYLLILRKRMRELDKSKLKERIENDMHKPTFNLYEFISEY